MSPVDENKKYVISTQPSVDRFTMRTHLKHSKELPNEDLDRMMKRIKNKKLPLVSQS